MQNNRTLTPSEELELITRFKKGNADSIDSIRAYRKLRATYRPKINLMADMYRKRGDNISQPQMVSVAEQMFPHWMHNYDPAKGAAFNTYIETQMNGMFTNEKSDNSVGYSYSPRGKAALIAGYSAARAEAQLNFGLNPSDDQIHEFWKIQNPDIKVEDVAEAAKYVRYQRSGDVMAGEDDEEGLRFDDQFRMEEVKLYDTPQNYSQMLNHERMIQFFDQNFKGDERRVLQEYYVNRHPIAFSVVSANMDSEQFRKLRAKVKEMAKKKNIELP